MYLLHVAPVGCIFVCVFPNKQSINPNLFLQTLQEVQLEGDCVQDGTLGLVAHDLNAGDLGQQAVIQDALVSDVQLQSTLNQQVGQNL